MLPIFSSSSSTEGVSSLTSSSIVGSSIVTYMFFGNDLGILSSTLQYDREIKFSTLHKNIIVDFISENESQIAVKKQRFFVLLNSDAHYVNGCSWHKNGLYSL